MRLVALDPRKLLVGRSPRAKHIGERRIRTEDLADHHAYTIYVTAYQEVLFHSIGLSIAWNIQLKGWGRHILVT
jgi:hypothetical protein